MIHLTSVATAQRTHSVTIRKTNQSMLFTEISVLSVKSTWNIQNAVWTNAEFLYVTPHYTITIGL